MDNNNNNLPLHINTYQDVLRDLTELEGMARLMKDMYDSGGISTEVYNRIKQENDETIELIRTRINEAMNR